jgi:hypothetical protein
MHKILCTLERLPQRHSQHGSEPGPFARDRP